jgi:hypothetical protein
MTANELMVCSNPMGAAISPLIAGPATAAVRAGSAINKILVSRLWRGLLSSPRLFAARSSKTGVVACLPLWDADMSTRTICFLTIPLGIVATTPVLAQHPLDLSLGSEWAVNDFDPPQRSKSPYYSFDQKQPTVLDGMDLSLDAQTQAGSPAKVSLGSVEFSSRGGDPHRSAAGNDSYYFDIPSQRLPTSAPGLLVKIPLENNNSP